MSSTFNTLPDELLQFFLSILEDYDEIIKMGKVFSRFKNLCYSSTFWLNKLEAINPSLRNLFGTQPTDELMRLYKFYSTGGQVYRTRPTLGIELIEGFTNVIQVAAGVHHYALITNLGHIYTWGDNMYGQLGLEDITHTDIPLRIPGFNNVVYVSCGENHTAFLTSEGQVYTFGHNSYGQLGLGDTSDRLIPVRIPEFNNVIQISCGVRQTAFVTNEGDLYYWGDTFMGPAPFDRILLKPNFFGMSVPTKIATKVKYVSCGDITAYITDQGQLYTFGDNTHGQLGRIRSSCIQPTMIANLKEIVSVSCGYHHTAAIARTGDIYTFGDNRNGQLGSGDNVSRYVPTPINTLDNVIQVSCGTGCTGLVTNKGQVFTWGTNFPQGKLGHGGGPNKLVPTLILGFNDVKQVVCGFNATLILKIKK